MKRRYLALIFLAGCHPSSTAAHDIDGAAASAIAAPVPDAGATADAASAETSVTHRLVVTAAAPFGATPADDAIFSWAADARELAILQKSSLFIVDPKTLATLRKLSTKASSLSERCFTAVAVATGSATFTDLSASPSAPRVVSWTDQTAGTDAAITTCADCSRFLRSDFEKAFLHDGAKPVETFDDMTAAGGSWTGTLTSSGHFIRWDTSHAAYVSSSFQDVRFHGHDKIGPAFGSGTTMSPDDRYLVDTGVFSMNGDDGFNKPPRLVTSANGKTAFAFGLKPAINEGAKRSGGIGPVAFCKTSQLFAIGDGKTIRLYTPTRAAPLATVAMSDVPAQLSFSPDGSMLVAASAKTTSALRVDACKKDGTCAPTAMCASSP